MDGWMDGWMINVFFSFSTMDAQYMPQPWRGPTDVTLVTPQISNNNSSMRLNNTKNSQLRSSARTLKQQPIINSPHELEVNLFLNLT
jgi:hypothetical protein